MPPRNYSRDIWDYLTYMPKMPSRGDRDVLLHAAETNREKMKRVHIWDYFFRIQPEEVGTPQLAEIDELLRRRDALLMITTQRVREWKNQALFIVFLGLLAIIPTYLGIWDYAVVLGTAISSIGFVRYLYIRQWSPKKLAEIEREYNLRIQALEKMVDSLRRQIPRPPEDSQVFQWLLEDIDNWLSQHSLDQTGLESRLVQLKDCPNPLYVLGPALLQSREAIPQKFLAFQSDSIKHLNAHRLASVQGGGTVYFYGVYYVEFIIVANDMLGNFGCFFDFITGQTASEHTAEFYYSDVVALNTHHDYRQIEIDDHRIIPIENAPTFGMALSNGKDIEVTFLSRENAALIRSQESQAMKIPKQDSETQFNPYNWAVNPEMAVENAIRALRARLRLHKGVEGESQ